MADAICRWRNPYIDTVREFIEILPRIELVKEQARNIIEAKWAVKYNNTFFHTAYQLACQLGLYHETNGYYYPKFKYTPTDNELNEYLETWIIHYTVPNPYTRSLPNNLETFSIHSRICQKLIETNVDLNWDDILLELFGIEIGNKDILKNSFKYSPVFDVIGNLIRIKDGVSYDELIPYLEVDINSNRENKEYFFDLFDLPNQEILPINSTQNEIITDATIEEINLINQLQDSTEFTQTEKNQIIKARIGQGLYRRSLIEDCPYCPITLVNEVNLLIASHIKPWRTSNNNERINPKNGILLTPTFDKLFDTGIITFSNDKRLLVSNIISVENKQRLNLVDQTIYPMLPIKGREEFLEFHRDVIFKG